MRVGYVQPTLAPGSSLEDATVLVVLYDRRPDPSVRIRQALRRGEDLPVAHVLGRVTVSLDTAGDPPTPTGRARDVTVRGPHFDQPFDPGDLPPLPWAKILTAAAAHYRAHQVNTIAAWQQTATKLAALNDLQPRRPRGRPDLGNDHYRRVAERYEQLLAEGHPAPVAQIGKEAGYSRNTAAGWVRKARERGFLPPAQQGRAG